MTPDIEQHPELILGILALIGAYLRLFKNGWLHKRKGSVSLLLTVNDTEENSKDSLPSTKPKPENGKKTDSSGAQQRQEEQQKGELNG